VVGLNGSTCSFVGERLDSFAVFLVVFLVVVKADLFVLAVVIVLVIATLNIFDSFIGSSCHIGRSLANLTTSDSIFLLSNSALVLLMRYLARRAIKLAGLARAFPLDIAWTLMLLLRRHRLRSLVQVGNIRPTLALLRFSILRS